MKEPKEDDPGDANRRHQLVLKLEPIGKRPRHMPRVGARCALLFNNSTSTRDRATVTSPASRAGAAPVRQVVRLHVRRRRYVPASVLQWIS